MKREFEEPAGLTWGHFSNAKGADIRYACLRADGEPKGTLVILQGFRESAEKYFEVAREKAAEGFDVWVMDWRGQGGSERYLKSHPQRAHHEGYDEQLETLHLFTQNVVQRNDGPMIMLAHSMGAHLGLRYLKEHEGVFDSAMLSAPMIDIMTGGLPKPLARQMAKFAKAGGYLEKYVPGGADYDPAKEPFAGNLKTGDQERFDVLAEIIARKPELAIGDPTYGWVYHTFQSIDILNQEEYLKSIKTPIMMQISDDEKIVVKGAQERAASLLPNCTRVDIAGARHEIWMEKDQLRDQWVEKTNQFMKDRLTAGPQPPKKDLSPKKPKPPGL